VYTCWQKHCRIYESTLWKFIFMNFYNFDGKTMHGRLAVRTRSWSHRQFEAISVILISLINCHRESHGNGNWKTKQWKLESPNPYKEAWLLTVRRPTLLETQICLVLDQFEVLERRRWRRRSRRCSEGPLLYPFLSSDPPSITMLRDIRNQLRSEVA